MQTFKKGRYSGDVTGSFGTADLLTSVTAYNCELFNADAHYHDNAHFSFALQGGCVGKKRMLTKSHQDRSPITAPVKYIRSSKWQKLHDG